MKLGANGQKTSGSKIAPKAFTIIYCVELGKPYVVTLLLVGIQVGIIIMPLFEAFPPALQVAIIMFYWAIVALIFSLLTNYQIKRGYDKPMRKLSAAAKKVAEGDFSVYVQPLHTTDKYDYIDVKS